MKKLAMILAAALIASLCVYSPAHAAPSKAQKKARAIQLMSMSMSSFLKVANGKKKGVDAYLAWGYNGCSTPPGVPAQGSFSNPCRRHDFGFANFGKSRLLDPTEHRRLWVNNRFRADMLAVCKAKKGAAGTACRQIEPKYYHFVNDLNNGAKAFYDGSCDAGYFCAYDDADQKGWRVQFASNSHRLADFAGGDLNDNIKSVWNRSSSSFRVFRDPDYRGRTACIGAGKKSTLQAWVLRDEVSSIQRGC